MKRTIFTLLILSIIGTMSCRKSGANNMDIKQYDQQQITGYIASNGLTGMIRDTSGGDTTGTYYKILTPGSPTKPVDYPDSVSFVFTIRSFDGQFIAADTAINHYAGYLGHISPNGLMIAVRNILKYKGASMRLLLPSHLAFGVSGTGSGSKTITNGRIAGNQCLDYYVNLINDQRVYDDIVIRNYLTANSLSGYIKQNNGVYYKITVPGTGTDPITNNSTITCTYTGILMNGSIFDQFNTTGGTSFSIADLTQGVASALQHAVNGTSISILAPSALEYGAAGAGAGSTGISIPANACLRFDFTISAVSP